MPRKYKRRGYKILRPLKTTKYSNETYTYGINRAVASTHIGTNVDVILLSGAIVPATNVLGTRKVKNFTVRVKTDELTNGSDLSFPTVFQWCLVFVPEGLEPSRPVIGAASFASMYEPNQNVILSGISDGNQVYVSKTRLARNLNSGDNIYFVIHSENITAGTYNTKIYAQVNYAISF